MSINRFAETVSKLQQLHPWDVPVNADVQNHIIALYNSVHGEGGEAFAERESRYINRAIIDDKNKWGVSPLSVFLAYVDLAVKNLTLEPGAQALCYLLVRSTKVTVADKEGHLSEKWESRCYISITGYGEILLRQRAGQIRHCDTPTIVYEGDDFGYTERNGNKQVSYSLNLTHNPAKPIACFMKMTRIDSTVDYAIILPEAWARLENFSLKQNQRQAREKDSATANALYSSGVGGSIDPGFLIAKCVKHAFKTYPKLPIGKGMVMEADLPDDEQQMPDYYSLGGDEPEDPQSFAEPADHSEGVTVDPAASSQDSDNATDDGVW